MNAVRFAKTVFLVMVLFIVSAVGAYAHEGPDGSIPDSQGAIAAASATTVQVTPNPDLVAGCGLRLVLVLDESGSIGTSAQEQVRTASQGFLSALAGTGSQAAVVGFAETADTPVPYTVINAASIAPTGVFGQYLAVSGPGPQYHDGRIGTYTNWEAAFQQVNNLPVAPDLVVFMTDGFPNTVVGGSAGDATTSAAIDAAAVRANVTKSNGGNAGNGSHIFAVGVGSGVSVDNMKPVLDGAASVVYNGSNFPAADYVVGDFSTLLTDLQNIAQALCGGTITVEKVFDPDGNPQTTDDRYPVEGWTFALTVAPPASAPGTGQTNDQGKVNFEIDFGGESTANASVYESPGFGQSLMQAGCTGAENNGSLLGFGVTGIVVGNNDIVKCTFVNTDGPSVIDVTKTADPVNVPEPGGAVVYTFTVTNESVADVVTVEQMTDTVFGDLNGQGTCSVPQVLDPGESYNCAVEAYLAGEPGNVHTNVVTAFGVDDDGLPVSDSDDERVTISNVPASIDVTKSVDTDNIPEPGGPVTFTVEVENTSAVDTVIITSLQDSVYGDLNGFGTCGVPQILPPTETYTCQFSAEVLGNPGTVHNNVVTAFGVDDDNYELEGSDEATVRITDVPSSILVWKNPYPASVEEPGGTVRFTVVIQNTSETDSVTIMEVEDSVFGFQGSADCYLPTSLGPGALFYCAFDGDVTGQPGYVHQNTVTVTGFDDDDQPVQDTALAEVPVTNVPSSMTVTKTADPDYLAETGGLVTFTVEVQNTSSVDEITVTSLQDSVYGDLNGQGTCGVPQTLAVGETYSCAFTAEVTGNAGDVHENVVVADAIDNDEEQLQESDSATVRINNLDSAVEVTKTAYPVSVPEPSGMVTFTVEVRNASPADEITVTSLQDSVYGDLNGQGTCGVPQTLAVGETYSCAFTAEVTGNAGDVHENVVVVIAIDDDEEELSASDDAHVTMTDVPSAISVVKTAMPNSIQEPGRPVDFTVVVTNLSEVDEVTIMALVDSVYGNLNGAGGCVLPQSLQPGDTYECQFTAEVLGVPGDVHTNIVTATGVDDDGSELEAEDDATVRITDVPSSIVVRKSANPTTIPETGGDVQFEIVVTNTSQTDNVVIDSVVDSVFGDVSASCQPALPTSLFPGESLSCIFTRFIQGDAGDQHENVASATGTDDDGNAVSDDDSTTVEYEDVLPSISLNKVASVDAVTAPGEDVTFQVSVTNTGDEPVTVTSLSDSVYGDLNGQGTCGVPQTLAAGETYTCQFVGYVGGTGGTVHNNVVTSVAEDDDGNSTSADDDEDVVINTAPTAIDDDSPEPVMPWWSIFLPLITR